MLILHRLSTGFYNSSRFAVAVRRTVFALVGPTSLLAAGAVAAGGPAPKAFNQGVRDTDPRTPEDEARSFHPPPGFEMQLFAAEPDIAKPINMAFDARGRLWVTETREYPFAAPLDRPGRDAIKVLEDTDGDGRADKITTFADGLNIPTGLLPYRNGVIAWSIPNIWFFEDTDGDGRADRREVLFGPLGWEKDTHGMSSSFRRGYDGWMYLTHGFSNTSVVRGKDGSELNVHSGNIYRVRVDGSRVEPFVRGQVNPFGLTFDPAGNLFSADCHSAPIYQLLRGAYYPSFSKPHDGLGFAPALMEHSHGSTAIAGIVVYAQETGAAWPAEFRNNVFIGNVMTSRINRDRLMTTGSTPRAIEMPDLLTTDDPWFRPVDLQLGPDGALYIADFYNRIIGHYEVPLDHPGRDRERGRIWRMVYRGDGPVPARPADLTRLDADTLTRELAAPNPTRRMLAMQTLADRGGREVVRSVGAALAAAQVDERIAAHGAWVLHRLGVLTDTTLARLARHPSALVREHLQRVLSEMAAWSPRARSAALAGLGDRSATVQRAAADGLGRHPMDTQIPRLLGLLARVPDGDTHLRHAVRMALRDHVAPAGTLTRLAAAGLGAASARRLADVTLGVPTAEAGLFLLRHVERIDERPETLASYMKHAARHVDRARSERLVTLAERRFAEDRDLQLAILLAVEEGAAARGEPLGPRARVWGERMAGWALESVDDDSAGWQALALDGDRSGVNPWSLERLRGGGPGRPAALVTSRGDMDGRGVLRSPPFPAPAALSLWIAGYRGTDTAGRAPDDQSNVLRLRDAATDHVLAEEPAPNSDQPQRIEWAPNVPAGTRVYLELVDRKRKGARSWIGAGAAAPTPVPWPRLGPRLAAERLTAAARVAERLRAVGLTPRLRARLRSPGPDVTTAAALASAVATLESSDGARALAAIVADPLLPAALRRTAADAVAAEVDWRDVWDRSLRTAPLRAQAKLGQALAATTPGAEALVRLVEEGRAPPRLLGHRSVAERLALTGGTDLEARVSRLVASLAPSNQELQRLIDARRAGYDGREASADEGAELFARNCGVCHRVNGQGGVVGPQLDGVGARGLERLLEDVLDPNRNVDHAFRAQYITLASGEVLSGLPRYEDGEVLVVADLTGAELRIVKKDIRDRRESETSLMPENFGEVLTGKQLDDLMSFLLATGRESTAAGAAPVPGAAAELVGSAWRKHVINAEAPFEGAGVADFDRDGRLDIFSGDSWYQGPHWARHKVREVPASPNPHYHQDFGDLPLDVNGDGRMDIVTCTFFGKRLGWVENPPDPRAPWIEHEIDAPGSSETCRLVDIDGDGRLDLLPAMNDRVWWYDLAAQKPTVTWRKHEVARQGAGHGIGIGDIDGDGRPDLIGPKGWWRRPAASGAAWELHAEFNLRSAGILIFGRDVDGDGLTDVTWGMGHDYGLHWLKQSRDAQGARTWIRGDIDRDVSQLHALTWADLDGQGVDALVTGKRIHAHEDDPGATDRPAINAYRFDARAGVWKKEVIYQGLPPSDAPADPELRDAQEDFPRGSAGAGLHIEARDIDGDGDVDLICPGKTGLYLFENLRR